MRWLLRWEANSSSGISPAPSIVRDRSSPTASWRRSRRSGEPDARAPPLGLYDGALAPAHLVDLRASGLTDQTIRQQRIRSVPLDLIDRLLGFPTPDVVSAYVLPFPDPRGGFMNHIRLKVLPSFKTPKGTVKYLQPKRSGVRCYFPLATLGAVRYSADPLYLVEGEKKALAVAQTGVPAIGLCGIEGWHLPRSSALHPDLDDVGFDGRTVNLIPDADYQTNPAVARAVHGLARACTGRGAARVLIRQVPTPYKGVDDYLANR